jgi:carboxyl-terminal processing protease
MKRGHFQEKSEVSFTSQEAFASMKDGVKKMRKNFLLVFLALGLFFQLKPVLGKDPWADGLTKIQMMTEFIQNNYHQSVSERELEEAAIKGILRTLDPHSYFLDPRRFSRLTEEYKGKYYGLGIMIQKQGEKLVVLTPLEGTPAWRLGIQPGDVISHINGESTKPLSSYEAMQRLRGKKGTSVTITIVREGLDKPFDLTIERAEIPLNSVRYAFMLSRDVGYIFINNFAETTTREFEEKMKMLTRKGLRKLILDLRGNGGGTFVQAIEMADEFLPRGTKIVSIKGRNPYYNREFRAFRNNQYEDLPLVILIDRGSASASEIVSGAIRDNDRGLIVGERSWGKGLVQTVFPLAPDAAVSITTAKYFTPSGLSIQRDYSHLEDYLFSQNISRENREVGFTQKGRKIYGQGGIEPDYEVKFSFKPLTARMLLRGLVFSYARKLVKGETALGRDPSWKNQTFDIDFKADERVIQDYRAYLKSMKFKYTAEEFGESLEQIKRELEREIASALFGLEEGMKVYRLSDPVVLKALEIMPEAEELVAESSQ